MFNIVEAASQVLVGTILIFLTNLLVFPLLDLKGTVAGRFLWQLGTSTVDRLGLASLQNCAFTVVLSVS